MERRASGGRGIALPLRFIALSSGHSGRAPKTSRGSDRHSEINPIPNKGMNISLLGGGIGDKDKLSAEAIWGFTHGF